MNILTVAKGKGQTTKSFAQCCLIILEKATSMLYLDHVRKGAILLSQDCYHVCRVYQDLQNI